MRTDAPTPGRSRDRESANRDVGRPADAYACGALDCRRTEDLRCVTNVAGRERVLCPDHARDFVEVSA